MATQWLVMFNPLKFEVIIFSRKRTKLYHLLVLMNNQPINEVNAHKHLGIIRFNDCTWHEHLETVADEASKRINVMHKINCDRKLLQTIKFPVSDNCLNTLILFGTTVRSTRQTN